MTKENEKCNDSILNEIEELARLQFTEKEIEIIMDAKISSAEKKKAYQRGRLKAQAEVRQSILKQAKQGSTPAQKQFMDLIKDEPKQPPKDNFLNDLYK